MREANVGILPVVEDGVVCGVLTDRDLVVRAIAREVDPASTRVGECATDDPLVVRPEWDVDQAMDIMSRRQVGRLPVVDEHDRPVGIVTLSSLALRAREDVEVLSTAKNVSRRSAKGEQAASRSRDTAAAKRKPVASGGGRSHRIAGRIEPGKRRLKRAS
jgi:signal-transduction protein with cAMP-binding, CBS, and nucleotidyltransferase domain